VGAGARVEPAVVVVAAAAAVVGELADRHPTGVAAAVAGSGAQA